MIPKEFRSLCKTTRGVSVCDGSELQAKDISKTLSWYLDNLVGTTHTRYTADVIQSLLGPRNFIQHQVWQPCPGSLSPVPYMFVLSALDNGDQRQPRQPMGLFLYLSVAGLWTNTLIGGGGEHDWNLISWTHASFYPTVVPLNKDCPQYQWRVVFVEGWSLLRGILPKVAPGLSGGLFTDRQITVSLFLLPLWAVLTPHPQQQTVTHSFQRQTSHPPSWHFNGHTTVICVDFLGPVHHA